MPLELSSIAVSRISLMKVQKSGFAVLACASAISLVLRCCCLAEGTSLCWLMLDGSSDARLQCRCGLTRIMAAHVSARCCTTSDSPTSHRIIPPPPRASSFQLCPSQPHACTPYPTSHTMSHRQSSHHTVKWHPDTDPTLLLLTYRPMAT